MGGEKIYLWSIKSTVDKGILQINTVDTLNGLHQ